LTLLNNLAEDFSYQSRLTGLKETIDSQEREPQGTQSTYGVDPTTGGLQKLGDFKRRMNEHAPASKLENSTGERITQEATDVTPQFEDGPTETNEVTAKLNTAVTVQALES
jgi:hypothetical protein